MISDAALLGEFVQLRKVLLRVMKVSGSGVIRVGTRNGVAGTYGGHK